MGQQRRQNGSFLIIMKRGIPYKVIRDITLNNHMVNWRAIKLKFSKTTALITQIRSKTGKQINPRDFKLHNLSQDT